MSEFKVFRSVSGREVCINPAYVAMVMPCWNGIKESLDETEIILSTGASWELIGNSNAIKWVLSGERGKG